MKPSPTENIQHFFDSVRANNTRVIEYYLERSIDPDGRAADGDTPLCIAVRANAVASVNVLLEYCADIEAADILGNTPLMLALSYGHKKLFRCLLTSGANLKAENDAGEGLLHVLAGSHCKIDGDYWYEKVLPQQFLTTRWVQNIVTLVASSNINIDAINYQAATPLIRASELGGLYMLKGFLDIGATPDLQDDYGDTALIKAVKKNRLNYAQCLLDASADPNLASENVGPPLFVAAQSKSSLEMVRLLLESGANPALMQQGVNCIDAAVSCGNIEHIRLMHDKLLEKSGNSYSSDQAANDLHFASLYRSILDGEPEQAKQLLSELSSSLQQTVYSKGYCMASPQDLMGHAVKHGITHFVDLLLKGGHPVDHYHFDRTALFQAVRYDRLQIAKLLIESGANPFVEVGDRPPITVIDAATSYEMAEIISGYRVGKGTAYATFPLPSHSTKLDRKKNRPVEAPPIVEEVGETDNDEQFSIDGLLILRFVLVLVGGGVITAVGSGIAYWLSGGIHGGSYSSVFIVALVHFAIVWVVFRLGWHERQANYFLMILLLVFTLSPVILGHTIGYFDMRNTAYQLVQKDRRDNYPAVWKQLSPTELFPKWIGSITGDDGMSPLHYLNAQASIGWEGMEGPRRYGRVHTERQGLWVWIAWGWHLILLIFSGTVAFQAAKRN
jgi:ankyrin repeat protein